MRSAGDSTRFFEISQDLARYEETFNVSPFRLQLSWRFGEIQRDLTRYKETVKVFPFRLQRDEIRGDPTRSAESGAERRLNPFDLFEAHCDGFPI